MIKFLAPCTGCGTKFEVPADEDITEYCPACQKKNNAEILPTTPNNEENSV